MLELLYAVEPQPVEPDYRKALAYLAVKQRRRALVVVFTDLTGGASLNSLVAQMSMLARSSLPLVVTISDPDVVDASQMKPSDSLGVYQRAAASQLLDERRVVLDSLRQRGVLTLDVPGQPAFDVGDQSLFGVEGENAVVSSAPVLFSFSSLQAINNHTKISR